VSVVLVPLFRISASMSVVLGVKPESIVNAKSPPKVKPLVVTIWS
jgi:hypothetical protein